MKTQDKILNIRADLALVKKALRQKAYETAGSAVRRAAIRLKSLQRGQHKHLELGLRFR